MDDTREFLAQPEFTPAEIGTRLAQHYFAQVGRPDHTVVLTREQLAALLGLAALCGQGFATPDIAASLSRVMDGGGR